LALKEDAPVEIPDLLLPDYEGLKKYHELFSLFKEYLEIEDDDDKVSIHSN